MFLSLWLHTYIYIYTNSIDMEPMIRIDTCRQVRTAGFGLTRPDIYIYIYTHTHIYIYICIYIHIYIYVYTSG